MQRTTFALIFLAMAGFFALDKVLATMERAEVRAEAARLYEEGSRFAAKGQNRQAAERFRAALADSRENNDYRLALASALSNSGKTSEAEDVLSDVLAGDANNGPANLAMARSLAQRQNITDAIAYYHRAIYGHWNAGHDILPVRLELIDLLDRQDRKRELLAELLPIQDELSGRPEMQQRLAALFLRAGSPGRAVTIYQRIIAEWPGSPEAHAGLGEALFQSGNYLAARNEFNQAARLAPDDVNVRRRAALCDEIASLDPIRRGLNSAERRRRSRQLLSRVISDLSPCMPTPDVAKALKGNSESEDYLEAAERLWNARAKNCPQDEAVSRLMAKLSQ